ncbi:hypothetical protein SAMN05216404_1284 [Nitrosospira multiformis]|uniref:Uncharacterized protein n=1 Tax=Nitrosospira multiformis TaxID=1231 RepID=A0A1H8Q6L4_9PROT|nr:hypothetical protein SAMN05216404_1284 [Nitrosospira multiformis]
MPHENLFYLYVDALNNPDRITLYLKRNNQGVNVPGFKQLNAQGPGPLPPAHR